MAEAETGWLAGLPAPSDELLDEIIVDLGLAESSDAERYKRRLAVHATSFAFACRMEATYPSIHQNRRLAASAAARLAEAIRDIDALSPLITCLVAMKLSEEISRPFMEIMRDMEKLCGPLSLIGGADLSSRQPDRVLRNAIGGLMHELEKMTGRRATASYRQSLKNKPARLISPEARAIARLLRLARPELKDTSIAGMINAISRDFRGRPLTEFAVQRLLGAPAFSAD